ncbi:MAG: VOC family protein [Gemmatimonadaceae bacterium]
MSALVKMIGFFGATDFAQAKEFYGNVLGFLQLNEDDHGMTFDANGSRLRVVRAKEFAPASGTVLGWNVDDLHETIRELVARGVLFEQFKVPFMPQDELGVWTAPTGDQVAWFKDPSGNVLSLSKHPF